MRFDGLAFRSGSGFTREDGWAALEPVLPSPNLKLSDAKGSARVCEIAMFVLMLPQLPQNPVGVVDPALPSILTPDYVE
jgi:hypothetical protein